MIKLLLLIISLSHLLDSKYGWAISQKLLVGGFEIVENSFIKVL